MREHNALASQPESSSFLFWVPADLTPRISSDM